MAITIWGIYPVETVRQSFRPSKKCVDCPFLFDYWCNYFGRRVSDPDYCAECTVTEITVEEGG